ncbi:hypothetical protein J6590_051464 [Homalodisca vitripennis]|nr:hypothetical protein J6590_051464 [Homalodisca vitripennis]
MSYSVGHNRPAFVDQPPTTTTLQFTFLLVQRLESDAVSDLTPGIWSHVRLNRSKIFGDEETPNELFT